MEATIQVNITGVSGKDPARLQSSVDEALTSEESVGISYTVMSAKVEDADEDTGSVGIELTITEAAIQHHFGENDAEDNMSEAGVSEVATAYLEKALNPINEAEFEVEDIAIE
jgi:hypothetical protein